MVANTPEGLPRIFARLAYNNPVSAVAFLQRAFGFQEIVEARISDDEGIALTEMEILDSKIMIGRSGAHGLVSPEQLDCYNQALIVFVDHIDQRFERAKESGALIVSEPADQFWGDRRFEVKDCEGHFWSFHEHVRDVSKQEMTEILHTLKMRGG